MIDFRIRIDFRCSGQELLPLCILSVNIYYRLSLDIVTGNQPEHLFNHLQNIVIKTGLEKTSEWQLGIRPSTRKPLPPQSLSNFLLIFLICFVRFSVIDIPQLPQALLSSVSQSLHSERL